MTHSLVHSEELTIDFTTKTRRVRMSKTPNIVLFVSFVVKKNFSICRKD